MPESSQMLKLKTSELESAVAEVQEELARTDATRRTETHQKLAALTKEARDWLEACKARQDGGAGEEAETADTRTAEGFLHDIRMHRTEL